MTLTTQPIGGNCPDNIRLLRRCNACNESVNRLSDEHVIVAASWRRCNEVLCRACWLTMAIAAASGVRQFTEHV